MNVYESEPGAMSIEQQLQSIKQRIDKARDDKARAEATLEQLEAQKAEVLKELDALGVSPENIASEIARLEQEVQTKLAAAQAALESQQGVA